MAEQTIELTPGESRVISFEAMPEIAKTYSVSVNGLTGSFVAKVLVTSLSGTVTTEGTGRPIEGMSVMMEGVAGTTVGIRRSCYTDGSGFYTFPDIEEGWYRITFELEGYVKESVELILTKGLNEFNFSATPTRNRAFITGIVRDAIAFPVAYISIEIEKSEDVPGYANLAPSPGTIITCSPEIPVTELGYLCVETGERITCYIEKRAKTTTPGSGWRAWDIHHFREYPDEYYEFSGSLTWGEYHRSGRWNIPDFNYSITGNAPEFAVLLLGWNPYGYPQWGAGLIGPCSGNMLPKNELGDAILLSRIVMYAHPNPQAKFDIHCWSVQNWQQVARITIQYW